MALDTLVCCWCEGRYCDGGGPHSCPWSAEETLGPILSGWWAGPGGNSVPSLLHYSLSSGQC